MAEDQEQQRKDKPEPASMADIANRAAEMLQIGTSRAEILSAAAQAAESFSLPGIAQEFAERELRAANSGPGLIESLQASALGLSDPWLRELAEQQAEIERLLGPSAAERILKGIQADFSSLSTSSRLIDDLRASVALPPGQALIEQFRAETWPGAEVIFPRPRRRPEPKPPAEPVQSRQKKGAIEAITLAFVDRKPSHKEAIEAIKWLRQFLDPESGPAPWAEIEALAKKYKKERFKTSQDNFARKNDMSRDTLHRWMTHYEAVTGERVLPRKKRSGKTKYPR